MRPSKDEYYLGIAEAVARRSTCLRRQWGAVIVNNDQIVSTGYNGSPRGEPNCIDTGVCGRRDCAKGTGYDLCVSVHAEMNSVIHAGREKCIGATLYLAGVDLENNNERTQGGPCNWCMRFIKNVGITRVVGYSGSTITTYYPPPP